MCQLKSDFINKDNFILNNSVKCCECLDVISSFSFEDITYCKCKSIGISGANKYQLRISQNNYIELTSFINYPTILYQNKILPTCKLDDKTLIKLYNENFLKTWNDYFKFILTFEMIIRKMIHINELDNKLIKKELVKCIKKVIF